ncbi:MAG: hypothetical protein GQ531_03200 [Sulfurovum sp.]|nr:hypothetical protein [Sulfurovum sp.]
MASEYQNTKKSEVPFGLKDGVLYEPSQVDRGRACNCICPSCKKPLIAKKGEIRKKHFTHDINTSCQTGKETAIHLAAKQIISQTKTVCLPSIELNGDPQPYGKVIFDKIILEKSIPELKEQMTVIPDITATLNRGNKVKDLYIEIAVTHFTEEEKIDVLRKNKFSAIEIDLSSLYNEVHIDFAVIENIIMNGEYTTWIYNQIIEDEKERIRIEDEKHRQRLDHLVSEKRDKMKKLIDLYNGEKKLKLDTNKWDKTLLEYSKKALKINSLDELPRFITQSCDIDALYPLDGRMVRLYIYENFVLTRENIPKLKDRAFGAKSVIQYLKKDKKMYPNSFIYDWYKLYKTEDGFYPDEISIDRDIPNFNSEKIISDYLYSLTLDGVLKYVGRYFYKLPNSNEHEGTRKHQGAYNIHTGEFY